MRKPSGTRGLIVPEADLPQERGRQHKQQPKERNEHVKPVLAPPRQVQKRVILEQRKRHAIGEEAQHLLAINGKRIHAELPAAVREDIHEFQPFRCKEAERRIDHEQACEHHNADHDHQHERKDLIRSPADTKPGQVLEIRPATGIIQTQVLTTEEQT